MGVTEAGMEGKRVVVAVEEAEEAKAALLWATANFLRAGDFVTLLHVFSPSRSRRKRRARRLKGFQLALSFKELCGGVPELKVEIVVTEGDQVAAIETLVNEMRASALVVGLHERSCLYRMTSQNLVSQGLGCRILAVKPQHTTYHGFVTVEFTQVELTRLCIPSPKIRYQICPSCSWRKSKRRKRSGRE